MSSQEPIMRIPLLLLPALAGCLLAAVPAGAESIDERRSITVSATGEVSVIPDMASISSGVTTEAATAKEALAANTEAMAKVIAGLKAEGVKPEDIQTTSFRVEPRYTRSQKGETSVIDGYRVVNQITILSRDLDRIGEVLDQLVTLGANSTGGLSFITSEAETLRDEARRSAVVNAMRRAKLYADAAGAEVGEVLRISESSGGGVRTVAMARMSAEAVPIERGSQTLTANVSITWALK
jgi:uncharacterized protein